MKQEELKRIIGQIKRYDLVSEFEDVEEVKNWLLSLNRRQINNFLNLNISLDDSKLVKRYLVVKEILNCESYQKRIEAIIKCYKENNFIKFGANFIASSNFYQDLNILSEIVMNDNNLINFSKLLEALKSKNFINSSYHTEDLQTIVKAIKENSNAVDYLIKLATNSNSINDKYHLENMQILAQNPIAIDYLTRLMSSTEAKGEKYYREEIKALLNAKSKEKAVALYIFIVNPRYSDNILKSINVEDNSIEFLCNRFHNISGRDLPDYTEKLKFLSILDDLHALFMSKVLTSKIFIESPYYSYDIEFLLKIDDVKMLTTLGYLIIDEDFINSPYHVHDLNVISKVTDDDIKYLLYELALDKHNISSLNHPFDMEFIANLENMTEELYNQLDYYLHGDGLNDSEHVEKLMKIAKGEKVEQRNNILDYLNELESNPQILQYEMPKKGSVLRRIRN